MAKIYLLPAEVETYDGNPKSLFQGILLRVDNLPNEQDLVPIESFMDCIKKPKHNTNDNDNYAIASIKKTMLAKTHGRFTDTIPLKNHATIRVVQVSWHDDIQQQHYDGPFIVNVITHISRDLAASVSKAANINWNREKLDELLQAKARGR